MKREEILKQRHEILEAIEQEFVNEMVPAKIDVDEELNLETLLVLMDDVAEEGLESTGEFFFMPTLSDNEDIQIFCNVITILERLNEKNLGELYSAIAAINSFIPVGCFTVNPADGTLIYKHNYELPLEVGNKVLKGSVDLCMSTAVLTVRQFAYLLVEIDEGTRTAQSAIDALLP